LLGEPCSTADLDFLCTTATKLFTVNNNGNHGNDGNQAGYFLMISATIKIREAAFFYSILSMSGLIYILVTCMHPSSVKSVMILRSSLKPKLKAALGDRQACFVKY
jgi:hypothetical protein